MVVQPVVRAVESYVEALQRNGIAIRFAVVFGSQVTGMADQWSDIDVLVVSPLFDVPPRRADIDLLWRVAARTDSRIEPVPCGERQWYEDTSSAIIEIARRQGEVISGPTPPPAEVRSLKPEV
jgi:predicted nucleotidyltransferase